MYASLTHPNKILFFLLKYGTLTECLCEWNKIPFIGIRVSNEIMGGKKNPKDLTNKNLGQHLHIAETHLISGLDSV